MKKRSYQAFLMSSLVLALALGSVGCENEGPAEQAGQTVDRSVEKAGDKVEDIKEAATK
jgi:hyperosmotically inducible protein